MNTPTIYIDVYKCGILAETIPFGYRHENDNILAILESIDKVAIKMEWEKWKINHICKEDKCNKGFNPQAIKVYQ